MIGAGPAGLACAHDLAVMGYRVTVFEATDTPGGMMYHGIPEFRLQRSVIQKEIERIVALGAELRFNAPLTAEHGLGELRRDGYEAVFLSVGTQRGRDLSIPGAGLDGVVLAIDFLLNANHGYRVELGRKVVVIGGGFVAFDAARVALRAAADQAATAQGLSEALDAARTAVRAGVSEVVMMSLESFDEMPVMRSAQGREEFEEARHEGVRFVTQRSARRFIGSNGKLEKIELIGVQRTYDENGRFNPQFDESIIEAIDADTVILAIGQQTDVSFLKPEDGIELTPQRTVKVDRATLATSAPGIFAGGDAAFGPRPPLIRKLFVVDWLAVLSPARHPVVTPGTVASNRQGLRTLSGIEVMNLFSTTAPRSARLVVISGAASVTVMGFADLARLKLESERACLPDLETYRIDSRLLESGRIRDSVVRARWHRGQDKVTFGVGGDRVGNSRTGVSNFYTRSRNNCTATVCDPAGHGRVLSEYESSE